MNTVRIENLTEENIATLTGLGIELEKATIETTESVHNVYMESAEFKELFYGSGSNHRVEGDFVNREVEVEVYNTITQNDYETAKLFLTIVDSFHNASIGKLEDGYFIELFEIVELAEE